MITANEIREMMKKDQEIATAKRQAQAVEWCEGFITSEIQMAVKDGYRKIERCAVDFDHATSVLAYEYLTQAGFEVRLTSTNLFTIKW